MVCVRLSSELKHYFIFLLNEIICWTIILSGLCTPQVRSLSCRSSLAFTACTAFWYYLLLIIAWSSAGTFIVCAGSLYIHSFVQLFFTDRHIYSVNICFIITWLRHVATIDTTVYVKSYFRLRKWLYIGLGITLIIFVAHPTYVQRLYLFIVAWRVITSTFDLWNFCPALSSNSGILYRYWKWTTFMHFNISNK